MTCTEEYKEHIESTFHAFCKVVIRNATINAARTRSRRYKREISLECLTNEKHYLNISCYEGHRYAFEIHQYT